MHAGKVKVRVIKTSFEEEQASKDLAFLKLKPAQRLKLHEEMLKRIWGKKYSAQSLKGLKVLKRKLE